MTGVSGAFLLLPFQMSVLGYIALAASVTNEVPVMATNRDGFVAARFRAYIHANAAPLSVIRVDLPFVQSVIALSGYAVKVAVATVIEIGEHAAAPMLESMWPPSL